GDRDVDAEHMARGSDRPREEERGRPAAAADIDDPLARLDRGAREEALGERGEDHVQGFLMLGPTRPARLVPKGDLVRVPRVSARAAHRLFPRSTRRNLTLP